MNWEIVIGLETHTQLSTDSKIFSGSSTAARPPTPRPTWSTWRYRAACRS